MPVLMNQVARSEKFSPKGIRKIFSFSALPYKRQKTVITITFLAIPLLFLLVLSYLPILNMVGYSFTSWDGLSKVKEWIGIKNYITVFSRREYFEVFYVSLFYMIGAFIQIALALLFATILSSKIRGANFFKGLYFFPNLINGVAVGFIFIYFFQPEGTLDSFLSLLGLDSLQHLWLQDKSINNIALAMVSVWKYMGFNLVLFFGAIQSIPAEIYEAADIDGANKWQQFWGIIFPGIRSIVSLNLLLAIKGALSVFEIPYIITGGGNGTSTFVIQTIQTAFNSDKVGLASAMAVVLTLIVLVFAGVQKILFKEERD